MPPPPPKSWTKTWGSVLSKLFLSHCNTYNRDCVLIFFKQLSLVFLVSRAAYNASYVTTFASVSFDFALRDMWVKPRRSWLGNRVVLGQTKLMQVKSHLKLCTRLHWLQRLGFYFPKSFTYRPIRLWFDALF